MGMAAVVRRFPRKHLDASFRTVELRSVLDSLVEHGTLTGYRLVRGVVEVHADEARLEAALVMLNLSSDEARPELDEVTRTPEPEMCSVQRLVDRRPGGTQNTPRRGTLEYYRAASRFLLKHRFQSSKERYIWELHMHGLTVRAIAARTSSSRSVVHAIIDRLRAVMLNQG